MSGAVLFGYAWSQYLKPRWMEWREMRMELALQKAHFEAQKVAKWRKEATKCCRNCHVPYKDQNPLASGKYMCSNCGHVSKKPELHVPGEPYPRPSKSCKFEDRLACWRKSEWWNFVQEELDKQSFAQSLRKCVKLLLGLLSWLSKTLRKQESLGNNRSRGRRNVSEAEEAECRKERAKRKAEERRLARLDREKTEEEERRSREEIKRLVDERVKLRSETLEAEDLSSKKEPVLEGESKPTPKKKPDQQAVNSKKTKVDSPVCPSRERLDEPAKRKERSYSYEHKIFKVKPTPGVQASVFRPKTAAPCKKSSPVSKPRTIMSKETSVAMTGTPPKCLCPPFNNPYPTTSPTSPLPPSTPERRSPKTSNTWKAGLTSGTFSWKCVSPEPDSRPKSPVSPLSSTSDDPIYFPGTARGLPPISAPHNTEPEVPSAVFTSPFFQAPVFPPPYSPISTTSVSSQLSADAPPFYYVPRPPPEFADPHTGLLMVDPVVAADGFTYERESSERWLATSNVSFMTGEPLPPAPAPDTVDRRLFPNIHLSNQIAAYEDRQVKKTSVNRGLYLDPEKPIIRGLYTDPLWRFEQEQVI